MIRPVDLVRGNERDQPGRTSLLGRSSRTIMALAAALGTASCSQSRTPYSFADALVAETAVPGARAWADVALPPARVAAVARESRASGKGPPAYLSLSGGAGDGAYGAGILNGWTASGLRPEFTAVSGVSTGALIAPFAFLGSRYDGVLRDLYTSGIAATLVSSPSILRAALGDSFVSNERLYKLVAQYVTPDFLAEIAREADRGRILSIVTTNLDAQRPVRWDMGRIARAGTPEALELFRNVLVASASVPVVFPPTFIEARSKNRAFTEMHVDGSVLGNVFIFPQSNLLSASIPPVARGAKVFVLLNSSPLPTFDVVDDKTLDIAGRTISLSIKSQTYDELQLAYGTAKRAGIDFNLTFNEKRPDKGAGLDLDPSRMRELFEEAEQIGRTGSFWRKTPPRLDEIARLEAQ